MRIGLMGGSFDPIHMGHLVLAEQVREKLDLDQVIFIPSGNPPHKERSGLSPWIHRYKMVEAAIASNPCFKVSSIEMDPNVVHYSAETVQKIKAQDEEGHTYFFIAGADALLDLEKWRSCQTLLTECTFVGATRPGFNLEILLEAVDALQKKYGQPIKLIEISALEVSASEVRKRVSCGLSARYLVTDAVYTYMTEQGLYRDKEDGESL